MYPLAVAARSAWVACVHVGSFAAHVSSPGWGARFLCWLDFPAPSRSRGNAGGALVASLQQIEVRFLISCNESNSSCIPFSLARALAKMYKLPRMGNP